jgi:hypothetical protein
VEKVSPIAATTDGRRLWAAKGVQTKLLRKVAEVEAAAATDPARYGRLWRAMTQATTRREINRAHREFRRVVAPPQVPIGAEYLSAEQAGVLMGDVDAEQVRELARKKLLTAFKLKGTGTRGKLWRFRRDDVIRYVESSAADVA